MEIDHEIISMGILLSSPDSFKKGCCLLRGWTGGGGGTGIEGAESGVEGAESGVEGAGRGAIGGGGLERLEGEIAFFYLKIHKKLFITIHFKTFKSYKGLKGRSSLSSLVFE